jgi:hypothetical protein
VVVELEAVTQRLAELRDFAAQARAGEFREHRRIALATQQPFGHRRCRDGKTRPRRRWTTFSGAGLAGSITAGPDGNLWFTTGFDQKIGRITTAGVITLFPLPQVGTPMDITTGSDGALWFTEFAGNRLGPDHDRWSDRRDAGCGRHGAGGDRLRARREHLVHGVQH